MPSKQPWQAHSLTEWQKIEGLCCFFFQDGCCRWTGCPQDTNGRKDKNSYWGEGFSNCNSKTQVEWKFRGFFLCEIYLISFLTLSPGGWSVWSGTCLFPFHSNEKKKTASQLGGEYKTMTKTNPAELFLHDLLFKSDRQRRDSAVSGTLFSMPFFKPSLKIAHLYVLTWGKKINNIFSVAHHGITTGFNCLHGSSYHDM